MSTKKKVSYILSLIAFLLRIVIIGFDFSTTLLSFSIYYPSLSKVGNDYYLTSITSIIYFLSFFLLVLPLKNRNKVKVCSAFTLLIASVTEVALFYVNFNMHAVVPDLLYEGGIIFFCATMLLIGYIINTIINAMTETDVLLLI